MKILLISPSKESEASRKVSGLIRFPQVSLLYVAALTPPPHHVELVEEEVQTLDLEADCDLVGITCMTATARRAYAIAKEFRKRGKIVVLGGVHPSVLPAEAKEHCDAVVVGEAEPVWSSILADAESGTLKAYYSGGTDWNLDDYPLPRREAARTRAILGVVPVVTSRGCPYACEFCCVKNIFGRKIRHVSVERVVEDVLRAGSSSVMFLDDNIVGDQAYATQLFSALEGLKINWGGQASISFVKNRALLDLAAKAGCQGLFIGLESVSEKKMERMNKSMRNMRDTEDAVRRIIDKGILLHASIVFGFDDDDLSIFDETLEFLYRTRIPSATFNILTPYPGTELYDQLKSENRLLTEDWIFYDHCTPAFVPRHMTVEQLYEGYWRVKKNFFSLPRIFARFPANRKTPLLFLLANLGLKLGLRGEKGLIDARRADLRLAAGSIRSPLIMPTP
jgi:radical SAM superfamily enzyme YgiQ (UPF0313 family)